MQCDMYIFQHAVFCVKIVIWSIVFEVWILGFGSVKFEVCSVKCSVCCV